VTTIEIEMLEDYNDCNHDGCSGGEEQGGRVWVDGELIWELIPNAGCWDNHYFPDGHAEGLTKIALKHLGIEYECDWGERDD
jgi:hypothetical protein